MSRESEAGIIMLRVFLLTMPFTLSLLVLLGAIYAFDMDYLWFYVPVMLLVSGGVMSFGVTLIKHIIKHIRDALK